MTTVRRLVAAAVAHLGLVPVVPAAAEAPAGPVEAPKPTPAPQPLTNTHSHHAAPAMIVLATAPFAKSPLTSGTQPTPAQIDRVAALCRNPIVQRVAGEARAAYLRASEFAAFRGLLNAAIAAAGDDLSPERVTAVLKRLAEDAEAALVEARSDQAEHDHVVKVRRGQLQPLRGAVGARLSALQAELDGLVREVESLRRPSVGFSSAEQTRQMLLQQAGVTAEEMAAMRAVAAAAPVNQEERRAQVQARIIEIKTLMLTLRVFCEAGNEAVLAGMAEFEPLIAARRAAEAEPA